MGKEIKVESSAFETAILHKQIASRRTRTESFSGFSSVFSVPSVVQGSGGARFRMDNNEKEHS
jgi:hypothetical protein